ncbi:MAG: secretion system protein [Opitutaceae bacterium]|nr:secretion system protein [Opitutaceae bacterium]|tara:strand:- start:2371 stop:3633 length:1263 start_codon:yes stop_codon:yes gene_type:complete
MADFAYSARDGAGQLVSSSLQASDRKEALRKIRSRGLTPVKVSASGSIQTAGATKPLKKEVKSIKQGSFKSTKKVKVGRKHVLPFLKNFHELHKSGLPISEVLRILSGRVKDPAQHSINRGLLRYVHEGKSFSESLAALGNVFDASSINLIGAGEMTGNLHVVLDRLIVYMENQREMRNRVLTSMVYPCIILVAAIAVVGVFLFVLMPKMQGLFDSLGGELPWATRLLIGLADFLLYFGPFILGGLLFVTTVLWRWHKTGGGALVIDRFLLRIPLLRNIIIYSETTQITQTLGLLLENGVTTVEAFKLTERTIANRYIAVIFQEVRQKVTEGTAVSKALESMGLMPDIMIDLISVGENTGNLVPSFYEVTRIFQGRLSQILSTLTGFISLGALLFAFLFVALIAFGIVSAIFGVSQSLSH